MFISFRDTTHVSPTRWDWAGWVGTWEDIVAGREGQYRVRLKKNYSGADCGYPGVEVLPDGTFVTTTYGHWDEGEVAYIRAVRFKLGDLDRILKEGKHVIRPGGGYDSSSLGTEPMTLALDRRTGFIETHRTRTVT